MSLCPTISLGILCICPDLAASPVYKYKNTQVSIKLVGLLVLLVLCPAGVGDLLKADLLFCETVSACAHGCDCTNGPSDVPYDQLWLDLSFYGFF